MDQSTESTTPEVEVPSVPAPEVAPPAAEPAVEAAPSDEVSSIEDLHEKAANLGKTPAAAQTPAYVPNYEYQFDGQKKQIDPMFHGLIKDAATEEKIRKMFQQSEAFPRYNEKVTNYEKRIKEELEPAAQQYKIIDTQLKQVGELYKKGATTGELDDFFEALKISDDSLFKYVARKLNYQDLPEEQRRLYDENRQYKNRASQLESEVSANRDKAVAEVIQSRSFQLDQSLNQGEIKQTVDAVDTAMGAPGAFRQRVIEIGRLAALDPVNPRDMTVDEAVKIALQGFSPFMKVQGSVATQTSGAAKPAVIKNVSGTAATPAKRVIRSLDDIRARQKELSSQQED